VDAAVFHCFKNKWGFVDYLKFFYSSDCSCFHFLLLHILKQSLHNLYQ